MCGADSRRTQLVELMVGRTPGSWTRRTEDIDKDLVKSLMHKIEVQKFRWVAGVLSVKGVSLMVVELYLIDGLYDSASSSLKPA